MRRIANVAHTNDVPDEVLAQAVAGKAGWFIDDSGTVFDQDEVFVATSLAEAAAAMRHLGWFTPVASGVNWRGLEVTVRDAYGFPPEGGRAKSLWADMVRRAVHTLR